MPKIRMLTSSGVVSTHHSWRACLDVLARESSFSCTLIQKQGLSYSRKVNEHAASGGTDMEWWGRKGIPT